jgi:hypothetical protein
VINLINDIQKAIDARAYCIALMGALTLPDICSALECADGLSSSERYEKWFDRRVASHYPGEMNGRQCYLHWFRMFHPSACRVDDRQRTERHAFVVPGSTGNSTVFRANGVVYLDLGVFCLHLGNAATVWLKAVRWTEPFETNSARIFTVHPKGIPGAVVKWPMIC